MSTSWVPCATDDGSWTLVHGELCEACHSRAGAWQQACERYARGCRLAERAREQSYAGGRCALLDIGTGLGLNLAAALAELEEGVIDGSPVALDALGLELDPRVIALGLELYERADLRDGPWERWHAPVRAALHAALLAPDQPVALGAHGTFTLRLGDARVRLASGSTRSFDAVFLDPFSPSRAPELWSEPFLRDVARVMAPGSWLATYSASFRIRLALARAGLFVGRGARVGAKSEGTLASPDRMPPALTPRSARRLARRAGGIAAP